MDNLNDPYGIIASAEQLVAELWKAEKSQAVEEVPWCVGATEDEVAEIDRFVQAWIVEHNIESLSVEPSMVAKYTSGTIDVYVTEVVRRFRCNNSECGRVHSEGRGLVIIRDGNGTLSAEKPEVILDRQREILERIHAEQKDEGGAVIKFDLADLMDEAADKAVRKYAEQSQQSAIVTIDPGDGGEDEPLPPAAIVGGDDEDPLPPAAIAEDAELVVEYRVMPWNSDDDEAQPSLLRRTWDWLRRR